MPREAKGVGERRFGVEQAPDHVREAVLRQTGVIGHLLAVPELRADAPRVGGAEQLVDRSHAVRVPEELEVAEAEVVRRRRDERLELTPEAVLLLAAQLLAAVLDDAAEYLGGLGVCFLRNQVVRCFLPFLEEPERLRRRVVDAVRYVGFVFQRQRGTAAPCLRLLQCCTGCGE